jgi:hypothetical protein
MSAGAERPVVVAGLAIALLGVMLLLDALGEWELGFGALTPMVLGVLGAILLASGLSRRV